MARAAQFFSRTFTEKNIPKQWRQAKIVAIQKTEWCMNARIWHSTIILIVLCLIFNQHNDRFPFASPKDKLSFQSKYSVIYSFECTCGCRYVNRTERCLEDRIRISYTRAEMVIERHQVATEIHSHPYQRNLPPSAARTSLTVQPIWPVPVIQFYFPLGILTFYDF